MAILSGRTHILFDGSYSLEPGADGLNIIAFNRENDLNLKPDPKYFTDLGGAAFPGTAVCVRFALQASEVESVEENR